MFPSWPRAKQWPRGRLSCGKLGAGFRLATAYADRAIVVATNDASSLRDAQRTVTELAHLEQVHLVMNRIQPKLLKKLKATIDDAMDAAGLPIGMQLIGKSFGEAEILNAAFKYQQAAGENFKDTKWGVKL